MAYTLVPYTGQKLIEWFLNFYTFSRIRFQPNVFQIIFKIQKNETFYVFAVLHTFARTMSVV